MHGWIPSTISKELNKLKKSLKYAAIIQNIPNVRCSTKFAFNYLPENVVPFTNSKHQVKDNSVEECN